MPQEVLVELSPNVDTPVTSIRGTLLVSSMKGLQAHGLLDRYLAALPRDLHATLQGVIAAEWVPIGLGLAHYGACDRLGLSVPEQVAMGATVADGVIRTLLSTVLRAAKQTGVTPWLGLRQFGRVYERCFNGGGASVIKTGPKDAQIFVYNLPVARFAYFRNAYVGVIRSGSELLGAKGYVSVVATGNPERKLIFKYAWA